MGLVGERTRHDVPGEVGEWIETRRLTWREMEEARKAASRAALETGRGIPPELMEALRNMPAVRETAVTVTYDPGVLMAHAVTDWSYPGEVDIDRLDAQTAKWLIDLITNENTRRGEEGED